MKYDTKIGPAGQQCNADNAITQSIDFLRAMFRDSERAWVAAIRDGNIADWFGGRGLSRVADAVRLGADVYFSQVRIAATENSRKTAAVDLHVMVAIDDVGSKVPLQRWDDFFAKGCARPCAIVETSPGNFQYFWRLS